MSIFHFTDRQPKTTTLIRWHWMENRNASDSSHVVYAKPIKSIVCFTWATFFFLLPSIAANVCFGMLIVSHLTLFGLVSGNINHNKIGISQEKKRPTNERKNVPMSQTVIDIPQRTHFDSLSWISDTILHFCLVPREFSSEFYSHPFYHSQPILVFINSNPVWQHIKCDILVVKSVCLFHFLTASFTVPPSLHFRFPAMRKSWKLVGFSKRDTSIHWSKIRKIEAELKIRCVPCWHGLKL